MAQKSESLVFYDKRVSSLRSRVAEELTTASRLYIDLQDLSNNGTLFRSGILSAEDVCVRAMQTYWAHNDTEVSDEVREDFAYLGHEFGTYAGLEPETLQVFWEKAQNT